MAQPPNKLSIAVNMIGLKLRKLARAIHGQPLPPIPGISVMRDIAVPMRDGIHLMVNIYRPDKPGKHPVLICMTPYGKDEQPEHYELLKAAGINVGNIQTSDFAIFEGPDPAFWVPAGYTVIHANARGLWNSEGNAYVFDRQNGIDYYDLIEWSARQDFSNGKTGLAGVSYLAWSQWIVASLQPPHLTAICPWEAFTDMYSDVAYHGGIPEVGFLRTIYVNRFRAHYNRRYSLAENLLENAEKHPLDDDYWARKRPDLAAIEVPALICASWSDQGLHTRGSLEGFKRISSPQKWLYTHGRKKWETYYSREALDIQKKFFDHFLHGIENGMPDQPPVRLEIRTSYYKAQIRYETGWPLPHTKIQDLFADAGNRQLSTAPLEKENFIRYHTKPGDKNKAAFDHQFLKDTELTGGMVLRLWVAAEDTDDLDLFIAIKKFDRQRKEVLFSGYNSIDYDMVAKGWLRVSTVQSVRKGEIVPVQIEILPSSTLFEEGSFLQVEIMGHEPLAYPAFRHGRPVNKGYHRIYAGGKYDSKLSVPIIVPGLATD